MKRLVFGQMAAMLALWAFLVLPGLGQNDDAKTEKNKATSKADKATSKAKSKSKAKAKAKAKVDNDAADEGADDTAADEAASEPLPEGEPAILSDVPDQEAMMKRWMEMASPGPGHEALKKFEGNWTTTTRMWMAGPDAPPSETKGTAEYKLILDGRYLLEETEGEMLGMPHKGFGMTGYDNFKKCYVATWADNLGTAILTMHGHLDQTGSKLTMYGQMDEFLTGENDKTVKYVTEFNGDDEMTFTVYDLAAGDDYKAFQIVYERQ